MTRLILTFDDSAAGALIGAGLADRVIPFCLRFVWGELKPENELDLFLSPRSARPDVSHWLDHFTGDWFKKPGNRDLGLVEFCERFETVELWVDPGPNAQLQMIWLLDHLRPRAKSLGLTLRHVDIRLGETEPARLAKLNFPAVAINDHHFEIASLAWQAFRAPTPHAWFDLLAKDLSVLPQLRRCVLEMLEELPGRVTGLGASEMRILELISAGYEHPFDVFPHYGERFQRRVFGYWEAGALLDRLALAPTPAVSGLAEWPFTLAMHDDGARYARYKESRLSLTEFGKAILAHERRFQPPQPDRSLVGRHAPDQRSAVALGSRPARAVARPLPADR